MAYKVRHMERMFAREARRGQGPKQQMGLDRAGAL